MDSRRWREICEQNIATWVSYRMTGSDPVQAGHMIEHWLTLKDCWEKQEKQDTPNQQGDIT